MKDLFKLIRPHAIDTKVFFGIVIVMGIWWAVSLPGDCIVDLEETVLATTTIVCK